MTLEQKIGQLFFPAVFINDTEENIVAMEKLIQDHYIGGLTFFHSRASAATNWEAKKKVTFNDESFERLKALIVRYQKAAPAPLLMSIDAEWGLAMRVEKTPQYPYAITLGALPESEIDLVFETGKKTAQDLLAAGIHYNLAPLADVNNNPNNPVIGYRSFGEDIQKVALFANAYNKGMNEKGVIGSLKHFPGHGNTAVDSHLGLPILNFSLADLLATELVPFQYGIDQGVDSIMIGHLAVPELNEGKNTSATLSKNIIQNILRTKMGYKGLIISDALNMHSVSSIYSKKGELEWVAFEAGNDALCFSENIAEGIQEILKNAEPKRIEESFNRVWACKEKAGIISGNRNPIGTFDWQGTQELNQKIAQKAITLVKNETDTTLLESLNSNQKVAKVSIYKDLDTPFMTALKDTVSSDEFTISLEDSNLQEKITALSQYETLLIALFVPKAKPYSNFEIEDQIIAWLSTVTQQQKVVFYLFGNPYALQVIPNILQSKAIVVAYQDLPEFQIIAAQKLLQNDSYTGTIPVKLNFI